jgi:hypothetical protein
MASPSHKESLRLPLSIEAPRLYPLIGWTIRRGMLKDSNGVRLPSQSPRRPYHAYGECKTQAEDNAIAKSLAQWWSSCLSCGCHF